MEGKECAFCNSLWVRVVCERGRRRKEGREEGREDDDDDMTCEKKGGMQAGKRVFLDREGK